MKAWLFVCSCIALITSAFTFSVRGDVLQAMGDAFTLTQTQKGSLEGAVFFGMALSMFFGGFICDALGMKKIMFLAFISHMLGATGTVWAKDCIESLAPQADKLLGLGKADFTYWWLYITSILMGFGNGFTEVAINPLVATLWPDKKTHYLNILHAWWPGGLIIGGLAARYIGDGVDLGFWSMAGQGEDWTKSMMLIVIPSVIYGLMLIPASFPASERVQANVSVGDMLSEVFRPMFLIWMFCMLLTAATELGPQKWQESVMIRTTSGKVSGTLILVYTSGMMFVLRHFAGAIVERISPVALLLGSSILSGVGLYLLSTANDMTTAFGYATIFGLGIAYFWPTMLGVAAERFPKGGALILALMGTAGNISISYVLPWMGKIYDTETSKVIEKSEDIPKIAFKDNVKTVNKLDSAFSSFKTEAGKDKPDHKKLAEENEAFSKAVDDWKSNFLPTIVDGKPNPDGVKVLREPLKPLTDKLFALGIEFKDMEAAIAKEADYAEPEGLLKAFLEKKNKLIENPDEEEKKKYDDQLKALTDAYQNAKNDPQQWKTLIALQDAERIGASMAFQWVSLLPAVLVVLFAAIYAYDASRGGYKAERIGGGH